MLGGRIGLQAGLCVPAMGSQQLLGSRKRSDNLRLEPSVLEGWLEELMVVLQG